MKKILSLLLALSLCFILIPPTSAANSTFADVLPGQWYTPWVEQAAAKGLMSGYSDGRFGPKDNVTFTARKC